jgi:hypothetical protein
MKCRQCKRKVRDSFADKMVHVMRFHPDLLLSRVQTIPELSRSIGEQFAELLKGKSQNAIGNR